MDNQILLEKYKISLDTAISDDLLDAHASYYQDCILDEVRFNLTGYLRAQHLDTSELKYPSGWWEAFKERWFPRWLLRKYPVKYTVESFDTKVPWLENSKLAIKNAKEDKDWEGILNWLDFMAPRISTYIDNNHIKEDKVRHIPVLAEYVAACLEIGKLSRLEPSENINEIRQAYIRASGFFTLYEVD